MKISKIQKSQPVEAYRAGRLILETLYGFGTYLTGLGSNERAEQVLSRYFQLPRNRYSYQYAYTAYMQEQIAGLLVAFPGKLFTSLNINTYLQMVRVYSLLEIGEFVRRTLILHDEEEVEKNEFYIAHLAASADFRRKGIGLALLEFAQNNARENQFEILSLMAECENRPALALYEKFGFKVVKTYHHPHQIPLTGSCGYVKMIKEI